MLEHQLDLLLRRLRPDAVNIHNLHGADSDGWSAGIARVATAHAPTVWTLHDMWSFTGRCAYSYDCRKFIDGCDSSCPSPGEYPALAPERIEDAWRRRRALLAGAATLVGVCPSRWLAAEARAGLWGRRRVEVIPNGLPLETYRPVDRKTARAALGLDRPHPVLLVAAQKLQARQKGAKLLEEALGRATRRPVTLLTLGAGALRLDIPGLEIVPLGYVEDEPKKTLFYAAADALVHPAEADNLPNVVMESIACATPVIGLPVGGVPEMVRPGCTGWLARTPDADGLAAAIDGAVEDLGRGVRLGESCRRIAEAEYGSDLQASRYVNLISIGRSMTP